jgi:hypothetical protein
MIKRFCGAGQFGRLLLLFVDSFVHSEGGEKKEKNSIGMLPVL